MVRLKLNSQYKIKKKIFSFSKYRFILEKVSEKFFLEILDLSGIYFETNHWSFVKTNGIITPYANLTVTLQITDL